ncbi:MAG TPA: NUDIX domain-containing protein [Candidatus Limnocylindrales bacterium]|nr:NUDIX domain-containing protein [Candidatus Limnocylindrales bacterium]
MIGRAAPPAARLAATAVLLRPARGGLEVLLTRRPASMRFGANLFVFPGGRLDPGESAHAAAARETLEETGIAVDPATLVPLTRWVTPPSLPIRYDTRFLGTIVGPGTDVAGPSDEVVEWRWLRPTEALEAMAANRMAMWQPTIVTLQQLEPITDRASLATAFAADAAAADGSHGRRAGRGITSLATGATARSFDHAWAGGVEGRPGTTRVLGARRWVIVDPGDPTGETSDRIVAAAEEAGVELAGVVVTSIEPERHAGVEMLATGLGLPVAGPPGASGLVPYAITELADAAAVPFGDSGLVASLVRESPARPSRWSDRAGRIRLGAGLSDPSA